ncbi:MAG: TIGR00268 family protein, partial [Clostridia bacterium]|nr:TIGR00268 family protein [Clostridia bacterium]
PGVKALKDLGIVRPLKGFSLTKREIRALSERLGLKTHSKPSNACLATRIAYGERVTREKLEKIEKAERFIRSLGFTQVRVRLQGGSIRIELSPDELPMIFRSEVFERVKDYLNGLSFDYVSIDMNGYKSGNMNKAIKR